MSRKLTENLDFMRFVSRHGEAATQAILETLERNEGIRSRTCWPLEERWNLAMQMDVDQRPAA